jgi:TM2 domain-containing membrane protein YozV
VFCSQCGAQVQYGASFCSACGARVNALDTAPGKQPLVMPSYTSPLPPDVDPKSGLPYSHRNKIVAGLLQIFLGGLGIGRFYTGHVGLAVAQILVTIFTCGLGVLWPLIDGIFLIASDARDAEGRPMRG